MRHAIISPGALLCILLVLTACKSKEVDIPFETIEQMDSYTGHYYQNLEPGLVLITQPEDVASLDGWVGKDSRSKLQGLNYNNYFALLVLQGIHGSSGFGVQINSIARRGNTVNVYAQFFQPNQGEPEFSADTSPYHLVKVEKAGTWGQEYTFQVIVNGSVVVSSRHVIP